MTPSGPKLMVAAGEPSGDLHAARLIEAVSRALPGLRAFGMGGEEMRRAGVEVVHDIGALAIVGFGGIPRLLPRLRRIRRDLLRRVREERPAAVVLVDYPGFNLNLARALSALPDPPRLVYFIPPQVWAWWGSRARTIARSFDLILTIFPFEPAYFTREGGRAEFVGNPVAHALREAPSRQEARAALGLEESARVVAFLPGSRSKEIALHLAPMAEAARIVRGRAENLTFLFSEAEALPEGAVSGRLGADASFIRVVRGRAHEVLRAADAAVVASGTATLETGLLGVPMVVLYAGDLFSFLIAKYFLAQVDYISLVNLLAGREVAPELCQRDVRGRKIASGLIPLLEDPAARERQLAAFARIREILPGEDPSEAAAGRIRRLLEEVA